MPIRTCKKCNKNFKFKDAYDKHMNRKIACDGTNMNEDIVLLKQEIVDLKNVILKNENKKDTIVKSYKMCAENKFIEFMHNEKSINFVKVNTKILKQICDKFKIKYDAKKRSKKYYHALLGEYFKDKSNELHLDLFKDALYKEKKPTKKVEKTEEIAIPKNNGNAVVSCVNACHNILRNNDSIVGEKAMHDIMRILFLKFIEPLITDNHETGIDLLNVEYYKDDKRYREEMEHLAKFSTFIEKSATDNDMGKNAKIVWKVILANHPMTKNIFKPDDLFNCKTTTLRLLTNKVSKTLSDSKFDDLDNDVKGKIYEEFLNGYNNNAGKSFGQYFTTRNYIKLIFNQIPKETTKSYTQKEQLDVLDPCMGTAGFLTETIKLFPNSVLNGCEIESETFNYALMNLILTTGELNSSNFNCCDSIVKCNPLEKVDFIPTNPPYGTKMNYDDLSKKYESEYKEQKVPEFKTIYPVKTNDGVALFLQMIVHKLKVDGLCVAIVPNGQLLFGKNFAKLRKYIMSKCRIEKIIYTPGGVFKHAGVKTAVLYLSKTNGENKNMNIKFMETTKQLTKPTLIDTIEINAENKWSWDASYYKAQEIPNWSGCEWKPMGDVCEIEYGTRITKSKSAVRNGKYPVYGSGFETFRTDSSNRSGLTCKIGRFGVSPDNCAIILDNEYFLNDSGFTIKGRSQELTNKFLFHYLIGIKSKLFALCGGQAQNNIDMEAFKKLKIPVPQLEAQQKIVDELEKLEKSKELTKQQIQMMKSDLEQCRKHVNPPFVKHKEQIEWKKLGDVCTSESGNALKKSDIVDGEFPVIGGGQKPMGYHNKYNTDADTILCSSSGYAGYISKYTKKVWKSDCFSIKPNEKITNKMYIYMYLKYNQNKIYKFQTGAGQPHVYWNDLQKLKIPVPQLEVQQEFVKFYEAKEQKINEILSNIKMLESHLTWLDDLGRNIIEDMICSN